MTHLSLSQPTRIRRRSTNEARSLLFELNRPLLPKSETAHLLTSIRANDTLTILRCNIYHTNLYGVATTLHNLQRPSTIKDTVHKNIRIQPPSNWYACMLRKNAVPAIRAARCAPQE